MAAIYFGYRATFGWFTVQDVSDDTKLATWFRERRAAVIQAPKTLGLALAGASAALALLLAAVAVRTHRPE